MKDSIITMAIEAIAEFATTHPYVAGLMLASLTFGVVGHLALARQHRRRSSEPYNPFD